MMDDQHRAALLSLVQHDRPFFANYRERNLYAWLVMGGFAECYVLRGGEERVRITDQGRVEMSATAENVARR